MLAFLAADRRLLDKDLFNLSDAEQHREPAISTQKHDRLVAAASVLAGVTLVGGTGLLLYGGWQLLFNGGGVVAAVLAAIGSLLVSTHWGWLQRLNQRPRRRLHTRRAVLHRPVLTEQQTFTFMRERAAEKTYDAGTQPKSSPRLLRPCAAKLGLTPTVFATCGGRVERLRSKLV